MLNCDPAAIGGLEDMRSVSAKMGADGEGVTVMESMAYVAMEEPVFATLSATP